MTKSTQLQTGEKFGRLTVVKLDHIEKNKINQNVEFYLCKCDCGNECIVQKIKLTTGRKKSCGCINKERIKNGLNIKHKLTKSKIYITWKNMKERCYNKNHKSYKDYGARYILVCNDWLDKKNGFINFYNWSMANSYNDKLEIDRIDNNGNYEPYNCRWVTEKEQGRNKRNNIIFTYNGETHCVNEWSEILKINRYTLLSRIIKTKWSIEKAFTTPVRKRKNIKY